MKLQALLIILSVTVICCWGVSAEIPHIINYQGHIYDPEGFPYSGSFTFVFQIFNAESGGISLWMETHNDVPVDQGILHVKLGEISSLDLNFDGIYWLEVAINGEVLEPRHFHKNGLRLGVEISN